MKSIKSILQLSVPFCVVLSSTIFLQFNPLATQFQLLPTEIGSEQELEEQAKREAWINKMHLAPTGLDWKAMDQKYRNGRLLASHNAVYARGQLIETFANGKLVGEWKERGSNNQAGRNRNVDVDTTTNTLYAVSDAGFVFSSPWNGNQWTPLNHKLRFDDPINLKVYPTGNIYPKIVVTTTSKIYFTTDNGQNWSSSSGFVNPTTLTIKRMLTLNDAKKSMILLAKETTPTTGVSTVIYQSVDSGSTFQLLQSYNSARHGAISNHDVWAARYQDSTLYFLKRDSLFRVDYSPYNTLFIAKTPAISGSNRTLLTGSQTDTAILIWAWINKSVYNINLNQNNWILKGTTTNDPFSDNSFAALYKTTNRITFGDIECNISNNGGTNWIKVNTWGAYYGSPSNMLHADIPAVESILDRNGKEWVFISTDGGLYRSGNQIVTVNNLSLETHHIGQYYSVLTMKSFPDIIYLGSQDQGFQRCTTDSGNVLSFDQVISGDYGWIVSNNDGNSLWMNYPGSTAFYANGPAGNSTAWYDFNALNLEYWIPPLMPDPYSSPVALLGGGSFIYQLTASSGNITMAPQAYNFSNNSNGGKISALAYSTINNQYRYVMTGNGRFFYSTNDGNTWTKSTSLQQLGAHYLYGATIYPSTTQLGVVYIGGSGYANSPVYVSYNNGQTFTAIQQGLPNTHVFQLTGNYNDSLIFAATEVGPFVFDVASNQWFDMKGIGAPEERYWGVEYLPLTNTARFITYGRGMWDFNISSPATAIAPQNKLNKLQISLFPNPTSDNIKLKVSGFVPGSYKVKILNIEGKSVFENNIYISQPNDLIDININMLKAGAYFLTLSTQQNSLVSRFIKYE